MAPKPVTITYEIIGNLRAICGDDNEHFEARSEAAINDRVVGHLIHAHDWAKADALAYADSMDYTPATLTQPLQPTQLI